MDPAHHMRFKLQPGVERADFVGQDVAPALLQNTSFVQALATASFTDLTFNAGTGAFPDGLDIPVTGGSWMTPVTGSFFFDSTKNVLACFVGGATGWIGFSGFWMGSA